MTPSYEDCGHGGAQEARDFTPRWMKVYTKMASEFTPRWTSLPQDTLPILIAPPARETPSQHNICKTATATGKQFSVT